MSDINDWWLWTQSDVFWIILKVNILTQIPASLGHIPNSKVGIISPIVLAKLKEFTIFSKKKLKYFPLFNLHRRLISFIYRAVFSVSNSAQIASGKNAGFKRESI